MVTKKPKVSNTLTGNWVNIRVLDAKGVAKEFIRVGDMTTVDAFLGDTLYVEVVPANGIVAPMMARVTVIDMVHGPNPTYDMGDDSMILVPVGMVANDQFVIINTAPVARVDGKQDTMPLWNGYLSAARSRTSGNIRIAQNSFRRLLNETVEQVTIYFHVVQRPEEKEQVEQ